MNRYKKNIRNILMTTDTVGGVWTYSIDLIKSMADNNIHFHLVSAGAALNDDQRTQVEQLENVTLHETEFKLEWMDDPWHDIDLSGWHLRELERKFKPDLVHLNSYSYASLPFNAPVMVTAHSDVFSWWFNVKKTIPGKKWEEYFRRVKNGIRNADCTVAPSQAMLNMLSAIYCTPRETRVIYNGRDESGFKAGVKQYKVMCAGRLWDEAKNLSLLADAAESINATIKIAGEIGAENKHMLNSNICFMGKLDTKRMSEELSSSLIYAAPARYEPFGLAILEAAYSGCALVLGDISSLREIWKNNALFVKTDDATGLAKICNKLLETPGMAEEYGRRAKQQAQLYSLEKMGRNYYELYTQMVMRKEESKSGQLV